VILDNFSVLSLGSTAITAGTRPSQQFGQSGKPLRILTNDSTKGIEAMPLVTRAGAMHCGPRSSFRDIDCLNVRGLDQPQSLFANGGLLPTRSGLSMEGSRPLSWKDKLESRKKQSKRAEEKPTHTVPQKAWGRSGKPPENH
jgi:hypothetical protein